GRSRSRRRARLAQRRAPRRAGAAARSQPRLSRDRPGDGLDAAESEERNPPRPPAASPAAGRVSGGRRVSEHIALEELEALALGQLERAAEIEQHVKGCAQCARELEWARAERALLSRRATPDVRALWA